MPYVLVDDQHGPIATITAPTGNIEWPSHQDGVVGQTLPFVWLGRNTNPGVENMLLKIDIRNPDGFLKQTNSTSGDIPGGGQVLNKINVFFDEAGEWRADAYLYIFYPE